jgi:hypothetical protein
MPGFTPIDFTNTTGWTTANVLAVKAATEQTVANNLGVQTTSLSYGQTEQYIYNNPSLFTPLNTQAFQIYRNIILKSLTDIVVAGFQSILENILIVAGSATYSNVAFTLGRNLNLDNGIVLATSVTAEQYILQQVLTAAQTFGAIFPQLRQS